MIGLWRGARVGTPVARGPSHRTVQVLFTYGSSGRRVSSFESPRRRPVYDLFLSQLQRELCWGIDLRGVSPVPFGYRHEPPFGEVRVAESSVDGRVVA